jgi:hypothetical protein
MLQQAKPNYGSSHEIMFFNRQRWQRFATHFFNQNIIMEWQNIWRNTYHTPWTCHCRQFHAMRKTFGVCKVSFIPTGKFFIDETGCTSFTILYYYKHSLATRSWIQALAYSNRISVLKELSMSRGQFSDVVKSNAIMWQCFNDINLKFHAKRHLTLLITGYT